MAIKAKHNNVEFGVGDVIAVHQKVQISKDKSRTQIFEGTVIAIKNRGNGKTFTVRRIGAQKIGIEQIFPLLSPSIVKIEVRRKGVKGSRRAKLYYIRNKSKKEIEKVYSRHTRREASQTETKNAVKKAAKKSPKTSKHKK